MLLSIDNARTQNVCSLRTVAMVTRCLLFIIIPYRKWSDVSK